MTPLRTRYDAAFTWRLPSALAVTAWFIACSATVTSPGSGTGGSTGGTGGSPTSTGGGSPSGTQAGGNAGAPVGGQGGAGGAMTGGSSNNGGSPAVDASADVAAGGNRVTSDGAAGGNRNSGDAAAGGNRPVVDAATDRGAPGSGGAPPVGDGGDRCNVGVYDPATPAQSLTITNGDNVHDPSMILSGSTYYVFNSGLWTRTSGNLSSWQSIAQVLFPNPSWIANYVTGVTDLWAPDISFFNGAYHLYYAASTFNSNRSCIGHATRAAMNTGAWAEDGAPVICSNVSSTVNWNAIDPNVILDEFGTPWLVFGSGWSGIQIVRLTASGAVDTTSTVTTIATRTAGVLEGAAMVRRCGYYYLFTSWDLCCLGANSTYNIRVGRSTSMTGGFVDKAGVPLTQGGGTLLLGAGGGWVGPGGESVMFNGNRAYLVYHAYAATDGHFALHVSDLYWDADGWPVTSATP